MGRVLAIDPGNVDSAYCVIDGKTLRPLEHDKVNNTVLASMIKDGHFDYISGAAVERVASYGLPVGREIFETCEWIGRFSQLIEDDGKAVYYVYRKDEKLHICGDSRAKDANIRRALIDRFANHDLKNGKGTKKNPDWFYKFRSDEWAAYACGITHIERVEFGGNHVE